MISEKNYNYDYINEMHVNNEDKYYLLGFQSKLEKAHDKNFMFLSKMFEMFDFQSQYALRDFRDIAWFSNISYDRSYIQEDQNDKFECELESGWLKVNHDIEAIHIDVSLYGENLYVDHESLSLAFIVARDKGVTIGRRFTKGMKIHVFDRDHEETLDGSNFHVFETKIPIGSSVDFLYDAPRLKGVDSKQETRIVLHITRVE